MQDFIEQLTQEQLVDIVILLEDDKNWTPFAISGRIQL